MSEPLPDAAITAAAKAVHDLSCRCGLSDRHHLPHDMELELGGSEALARVVLEAAAPALRAQGAATERARIARLLLDDGWPRMQLERLGVLYGTDG